MICQVGRIVTERIPMPDPLSVFPDNLTRMLALTGTKFLLCLHDEAPAHVATETNFHRNHDERGTHEDEAADELAADDELLLRLLLAADEADDDIALEAAEDAAAVDEAADDPDAEEDAVELPPRQDVSDPAWT